MLNTGPASIKMNETKVCVAMEVAVGMFKLQMDIQ